MHTTRHWGQKERRSTAATVWALVPLGLLTAAMPAYAADTAVEQRVRASARADGGSARVEIFIRTVQGGTIIESYSERKEGTPSIEVRYVTPGALQQKEAITRVRAAASSLRGAREETFSTRSGAQAAAAPAAAAPKARAQAGAGKERAAWAEAKGNAGRVQAGDTVAATEKMGTSSAADGEEGAPKSQGMSVQVRSADSARVPSVVRTFISIIHNSFNSFISYALNIF